MDITIPALLDEARRALTEWPFIPGAEATHGLPWGMLLAIGSRETDLTDVLGDGGASVGPWQQQGIPRSASIEAQANSAAATLAANARVFQGDWRLAADAYNRGVAGVKAALAGAGVAGADALTYHGNYGPDVMARLAVLQAHRGELVTNTISGPVIVSPATTGPGAKPQGGSPMFSLDRQSGRITCPSGAIRVGYSSPFPVTNGSPGGFVEPAWGICQHTEDGSEQGTISWFADPAAQVSAHLSVGLDGAVHQYGPLGHGWMAWAEVNGNPHYISIEAEDGGATIPFSGPQLQVLAELYACLADAFGFPLVHVDHGGHGITQHCWSDGAPDPAWGDHPCPGAPRLAQMQGLVERAAALAHAHTQPNPAPAAASHTLTVHGGGAAGGGGVTHIVSKASSPDQDPWWADQNGVVRLAYWAVLDRSPSAAEQRAGVTSLQAHRTVNYLVNELEAHRTAQYLSSADGPAITVAVQAALHAKGAP